MSVDKSKSPDFFSIFVFPFKYSRKDGGVCTPKEVADLLVSGNNSVKTGWSEETFDITRPENYNEWNYFHPFVRSMLFSGANSGMKYLSRVDYTQFCVQYIEAGKPVHIDMKVQSIDLHLYENQIGLLTITTEKEPGAEYSFDQLLRYNDLARRVSPQFLEDTGSSDFATATKEALVVPSCVTLNGPSVKPLQELFEVKEIRFGKNIPYLSRIIKGLLSPLSLKGSEESLAGAVSVFFEPYTDDRMFVISYLADADLSGTLRKLTYGGYHYQNSADWYRFMFVDGGSAGVANYTMRRELIAKHTYARWAMYGTLYGMTRYSFVALCEGSPSTDKVVYIPMKGCYYQIALVVLFQRAMLLHFSERVRTVIDDYRKAKSKRELNECVLDAKSLQLDFISYTTKYSFSEVSPQEQGIEMYNQWTKSIELDELYHEVKEEIDQLSNFVQTELTHETDSSVRDLTLVMFVLTMWLVLFGDFLFEGRLLHWFEATIAGKNYVVSLAGILCVLLIAISIPIVPKLCHIVRSAFHEMRRRT